MHAQRRKKAWLFDVDGVLTHSKYKRVTEPQLFDHIIGRLIQGDYVALNTGRSLDFLSERIIAPIKKIIGDTTHLQNFLAVGEKGATILNVAADGKETCFVDPTYSVPQSIQSAIRTMVENEFADSMFYDTRKKTMISVEMLDEYDVLQFQNQQKILVEKIQALLGGLGNGQFEIDPTRIATDIQDVRTSKALGARRVVEWIQSKGADVGVYYAFGDSPSDLAMAEELVAQNLPVQMVFVGEPELIGNTSLLYDIIFTQSRCEQGTLEFLKAIK